jgi:hypothetical protein
MGERIKVPNEIASCTKSLSPTSNTQSVFKKALLVLADSQFSVFRGEG